MQIIVKKEWNRIRYAMIAAFALLAVMILACASAAQPDDISNGSVSIEETLSETVVNCMLQDSTGFLWLGTQVGLYKYNGYNLKPHIFRSTHATKFASNFITAICEDNAKNIWVGTFGGGLFKVNPQTGVYTNFSKRPHITDGLSDNMIRAICKDDSGKLWIGTQNNGIDCLDPMSGHFIHDAKTNDNAGRLSANTITSIRKDKTGGLWIGTVGGGLNKLEPGAGKLLRFNERIKASGMMRDDNISTLYIDRANVLWIVTEDGKLSSFDIVSGKSMHDRFPELKDLKISAICEDCSGTLWVGTYGNGLRMLDKASRKFIAHGCDFSQNTSSCNYRVRSLYADTSGNLWIGTEGSGLAKMNTNLNFISYKSNMNSGMNFSDDVILSIYKDKSGIVWTGTANGGVNRFDRENNRITYYKNNPKDSGSISSNAISSIYEDNRGIFWFGAIDGILNRFEPATGKFIHYKIKNVENSSSTRDNGIMRIHEGKDGMLWICAAHGGLVKFDRSKGQYTQFTHGPQNPYSISSNHVLSIAEDSSGIFWIGTSGGGLNKLDSSTNQFTHYRINNPDSNAQTLKYNVNAIVNDNDILWLATDRGLFKFVKNSGKSIFVRDRRQIANTFVYGLLKDGKNNLWLSTANGLIKYNIRADVFKKYGFHEGLQRNQYNGGAYYKSRDAEMFFGGTNGFSCFYADKIKDNTHKPPVVITGFKIFDAPTALSGNGKVSMTYRDNFISFEFAALDFANQAKNQYAYKLEGFDQDWHYCGTRNYANYTNLDDGEYTLRIKAANNDGYWNERGTRIKFVITPPFWKTSWFLLGAIIFASTAIILLFQHRTRSMHLKSLELERQVIERTKELNRANEQLRHADDLKSNFLSIVSHEIRTPLSAILGFTELIADKLEKRILPNIDLKDRKIQRAAETIGRDLSIIISEGDRLATLINNLLNLSKIESGKMDWRKEIVDISKLIEQSLLVTMPILEKKGLAIHVDIAADLPKISGDNHMLTQVLINLISNAAKFTKEGSIRVCAKNSGSAILVSIEDTGTGIPEDHLDKIFERFYKVESSFVGNNGHNNIGLGLYICKQIIEMHGGKIWVESQFGKGSIFYFRLTRLIQEGNITAV